MSDSGQQEGQQATAVATPAAAHDYAKGFALMLETACRDFEALTRMIRGEIRVVTAAGTNDSRDSACIRMALAKSFLFNAQRARRICEHGASYLSIMREDRIRFLKGTEQIGPTRDVNEHGFDPGTATRGKTSKPSMHHHEEEKALLDETSLIILGDAKILMGPLNLRDVYVVVDRMRQIAGFRTLVPTR
jgi:hypothetical protein